MAKPKSQKPRPLIIASIECEPYFHNGQWCWYEPEEYLVAIYHKSAAEHYGISP